MNVNVISGSRADAGLLQPVYAALQAAGITTQCLSATDTVEPCDCAVVLGDRHEILKAAIGYYMHRIPIAHLCGGDVTLGSYDDAFRDCISRLATWHFVTNDPAKLRLERMGYTNVHMVGTTSVDVINAHRSTRRIAQPYVLVSYQPETATGENRMEEVLASLAPDKTAVIFTPNDDVGSEHITEMIHRYARINPNVIVHDYVPHGYFLDLLDYCDEFIGNSSSMLYEAPFMGVRTRMIGDRQKGRVQPSGDGSPSLKIVKILKDWHDSFRYR